MYYKLTNYQSGCLQTDFVDRTHNLTFPAKQQICSVFVLLLILTSL